AALGTLAALAALVFIPAELRLEGKGTLEPVHRRDVFAGIDGVVEKLEAGLEHGAEVKAGQLLATLRNTDLEVAITDVLGRKASSEEQLVATRRALLEDKKISADEKTRLAGRAAQLQREIESLEQQRKLYETKKHDLEVKSPIDGVIVTWQVRDRLMLRPVEKGQSLMSIADKTGPWELEVHMPDDRLGHVNRAALAAKQAGRELTVDYILATDPGTRHHGTVKEIHEQAEVRGEAGNTVLVRVTIDPERHEKEELGAGATVTARIACGKRPLGYVWFHDVLAFIHSPWCGNTCTTTPSSGDLISRRSIAFSAASTSTPFEIAANPETFFSSCACSICSSLFCSLSWSRLSSTRVTLPGTLRSDS
ncbi:MAG: efflux RND transporter periplasmic adaptor subunit, partial [Planctomycetia bacterium]